MPSSSGETDLRRLIRSMSPALEAETYVFGQLSSSSPRLAAFHSHAAEWDIKMLFREAEAWTLVLPQRVADAQELEYAFPCRQITLNVHSSLDAVGFLAAITTRLAEKLGIGVNPVSGFYHDHLFVPLGSEDGVLEELKKMAAE